MTPINHEALNLQISNGDRLSAPELHDLLKLRVDVFVVEQKCPYPELDGKDIDAETRHLWFADDEGVMATVRILNHPDGKQVGRVVTRSDCRGAGLATALMLKAHTEVGSEPIFLSAQTYLQPWYDTLGYQVTGPEYIEDEIPHVPMKRDAK